MVHLVSHELRGHRLISAYDPLEQAIKGISGTWCHIPESKWLVETEFSTQNIAERLAPLTRIGDPIFVTRIHRDWFSYSLTPDQIAWLNGRNFGSVADAIGLLFPPLNMPPAWLTPKSAPENALRDAVLGKRRG